MKYSTVFWDWNGTLLDDLSYSIDCINDILLPRGLEPMTVERYYRVFGFPVIEYYKRIGIDLEKEDFSDVAVEYIDRYNADIDAVPLRKGAKEALTVLFDKKIKQYILTASDASTVTDRLKHFHVERFFADVIGLDNIYAHGKADIAKTYILRHPVEGRAVLIGDTLHDAEVAKEIGIDCILVAGGHASELSLRACGCPVVDAPNKIYPLLSDAPPVRQFVDVAFIDKYKTFYDDLKNTSKTEDW